MKIWTFKTKVFEICLEIKLVLSSVWWLGPYNTSITYLGNLIFITMILLSRMTVSLPLLHQTTSISISFSLPLKLHFQTFFGILKLTSFFLSQSQEMSFLMLKIKYVHFEYLFIKFFKLTTICTYALLSYPFKNVFYFWLEGNFPTVISILHLIFFGYLNY